MKRAVIVLGVVAAVAICAAVALGVLYVRKDDIAVPAAPCGDRLFGHISTVTASGDHFVMRFDPALFTSGETANVAAAEDGVIEPGDATPNDNYVVDEGHRLFTYLVPADAPVRVVTNQSPASMTTEITVDQLAQLVTGKTPVKLWEPLTTGVWLRVHVDTVCDIEQQYKP